MNRTKFSRPIGLTALLLTLFLLIAPMGAMAAEEEPDDYTQFLTNLPEAKDLTIAFWFDVEFPAVTLIHNPTGQEYPLTADNPDIQINVEAEYALVQIPSAPAGEWSIRYSVGKNTEFEYDLMGMTENIWIQYVNAAQGSGNRMEISFLATRGEEVQRYDYKLYLTYDKDGASTLLLREGYAYTGEEEDLSINFSAYNSYDSYQLLLEVELYEDGVTLFDSLESDPFAFENQNTLTAPGGVDLTVSLTDRMLTADWDNYTSYRYNGYRVVIADAKDDVLYSGDFDSTATQMTQYITEKTDRVTVTFYGMDDGRLSEPVTRTVQMTGGLTLLTKTPTASSQAQFKMNLPKDTVLSVLVGANEHTFTSEGKENTVAVTLANGVNELSASYLLDGVTYTLSEMIFKDGIPPQIDFFEPYQDKVFPDGKAVLVGSVGDAVKLLLNGKEVKLEAGLFEIKLDLEKGANNFLFEATDAAGNASSFQLTLFGSKDALVGGAASNADVSFWIPLIVGIALGVGLIIFAIVLAVRKNHLKTFSTTPIVVLFTGTTLAALAMLIFQTVRKNTMIDTLNSYGFMKIVRQSLADAYAYLIDAEGASEVVSTWLWIFLGSLGALILSVAVHILVKVIVAKKRQKKAIAPSPAPVVEQVADTSKKAPKAEAIAIEEPAQTAVGEAASVQPETPEVSTDDHTDHTTE